MWGRGRRHLGHNCLSGDGIALAGGVTRRGTLGRALIRCAGVDLSSVTLGPHGDTHADRSVNAARGHTHRGCARGAVATTVNGITMRLDIVEETVIH